MNTLFFYITFTRSYSEYNFIWFYSTRFVSFARPFLYQVGAVDSGFLIAYIVPRTVSKLFELVSIFIISTQIPYWNISILAENKNNNTM